MGLFFKSKKTSSEISTESLTKGKNPKMFDVKAESELLQEYKKFKGKKNASEYFSALPLISFYYKFRNLDDKYLNECMYYCNLCISLLDTKDMKHYVDDGIVIPAFKQMVIIYENKKEYTTAIKYAKRALKYSKHNKEETEYYKKKIKSIQEKAKK